MAEEQKCNRLKMQSSNLTERTVEKLAELFPNCVTESQDGKGDLKRAIDIDLLRQELSDLVVDGPRERYQLNWPGKREALLAANAPIAKTLRPCRNESVDFNTTKNLFIKGDNLDTLKLLQETYLNRVKLIYIDPPYNTGNDFVYKDDFSQSTGEFFAGTEQMDDQGNRLVANYESNGRFHSDWMSMMYSRLKLSKNLLTDDGIILVSIGPEELKNLIGILGEVFGESNRISILTWEKGRKNDSRFFSDSAEYMVVFAKNKAKLSELGTWRERKEGIDSVLEFYDQQVKACNADHVAVERSMRKFYQELPDYDPRKKLKHFARSDDRGLFFGDNISSASTSIPDYDIIHPTTEKPVKKPTRGWGATQTVMMQRIAEDRVLFGEDETTIPLKKSYLFETDAVVKTPVIYKDGRAASRALRKLLGDDVFNNPKDHHVLADLVSYCLQGKRDAIVMDFFAGSASTAHSVMELNAKDGGTRSYILVQYPEILDPSLATTPASKKTIEKAIEFLKGIGKPLTIAEIGIERIRRAGREVRERAGVNADGLDIGVRVFETASSNMKNVYYTPDSQTQDGLFGQIDNIREGRSDEDLLFQVLLDWGVDLALPIQPEKIAGKNVYLVDEGALAACFETGIDEDFVKALAERKPLRAVFRDSGYGNDSTKINVEQIFKLISPTTEVKTL